MYIQLSTKSIVGGKPVPGFAGTYLNTQFIAAVVEDDRPGFVKVIPSVDHINSFLVKKEEWDIVKKKIEADQRKQQR